LFLFVGSSVVLLLQIPVSAALVMQELIKLCCRLATALQKSSSHESRPQP
jgi:hypothetical protein